MIANRVARVLAVALSAAASLVASAQEVQYEKSSYREMVVEHNFLGGLLSHFVEKHFGGAKNEEHHGQIHRKGMLFAAGLITGEALMGIFIAIPIVVTGKGDVLALPANLHFGGWLGLALLAWIAWLLYRFATKPDAQVAAQ